MDNKKDKWIFDDKNIRWEPYEQYLKRKRRNMNTRRISSKSEEVKLLSAENHLITLSSIDLYYCLEKEYKLEEYIDTKEMGFEHQVNSISDARMIKDENNNPLDIIIIEDEKESYWINYIDYIFLRKSLDILLLLKFEYEVGDINPLDPSTANKEVLDFGYKITIIGKRKLY